MARPRSLTLLSSVARNWLPPMLIDALRPHLGSMKFFGDFDSWQAAAQHCEGYATAEIFERVASAALAAHEGRVQFDRDATEFDRIEYAEAVLAGLLLATGHAAGRLHVLDFGGALGSSYRQNQKLLAGVSDLQWSIVEQRHFVERGKRDFEDATLRFFQDIESFLRSGRSQPNVVLASSVLPYLEQPYAVLSKLMDVGADVLIVDRTYFLDQATDRLCIQKVRARIFSATMPTWFLSREKFLRSFEGRYALVEEFSKATPHIPARQLGHVFRRIGVD